MLVRGITCVAIEMTTHCDRRCPDCCANIGQRPTVHHDWSYFERAAESFYGADRVHITGGEPTVHPKFAEFVPKFRELFGCRLLTLQTDAFRTERYVDVLSHFDKIYASRYDERNTKAVDVLVASHDTSVFEGAFTPRARRGSGAGCFRGLSDTVAFADGRLFGCCVGPGIPGAPSIEPSKDWAVRAESIPLPCGDCWFSE